MARASESAAPAADHGIFHPRGSGPEFVLTLLRGWRAGWIACPLEQEARLPLPGPLPPNCAHLKWTSATTGAPRLVAFSCEQLCADADHILHGMALHPEWANVAAISLAHSYGFSNLVLLLALHGMPLILAGGGLPEQLRAAAAVPDMVLPSVPALWRTWWEAGVIPEQVRVAISAGAPLPLNLEQHIFQRHGLKVHNFYGSTECGGIAYDASAQPRQEASLAGNLLPGVHVNLSPEGCVEVRGPNVGLGYWPEADPALAGGVFRTRDLGELREGLLFLQGRASDQINIAGRKVSPETIEQVLRHHPQVRECVVFGIPDLAGHRGEAVVAAVALHNPSSLAEVRQHTQNLLPAWQWPKHWWVVPDLAANQRGKISRAQWAARYQAARQDTPATASASPQR